jgi:hypothetical protein
MLTPFSDWSCPPGVRGGAAAAAAAAAALIAWIRTTDKTNECGSIPISLFCFLECRKMFSKIPALLSVACQTVSDYRKR